MTSDELSLLAGGISIVLAILAIVFGLWTYMQIRDLLTQIRGQAETIEQTVTGSQADLLKAMLKTTERQQEIVEKLVLETILPRLGREDESRDSEESDLPW